MLKFATCSDETPRTKATEFTLDMGVELEQEPAHPVPRALKQLQEQFMPQQYEDPTASTII